MENFDTPSTDSFSRLEDSEQYENLLEAEKGIGARKAKDIRRYVERQMGHAEVDHPYGVFESEEIPNIEGVGEQLWTRARKVTEEFYLEE